MTISASSPTRFSGTPPRPAGTAGRPGAISASPAAYFRDRTRAFRDACYLLGPKYMLQRPTRAEAMRALGSAPRFAWVHKELAEIGRREEFETWALRTRVRAAGGGPFYTPEQLLQARDVEARQEANDREARDLRRRLAENARAIERRAISRDLDEALDRGGRAGVFMTRRVLERARMALRSRTA